MTAQGHHRTLVKAAALHAGSAVARLVDLAEPKEVPPLRRLRLRELAAELFPSGEGRRAVFADLSGAVRGRVGVGLAPEVIGEFVSRLVGTRPEPELVEPARSALTEVGNIALSAAAGVLGHLAGGVVIPSVPRLVCDLAEAFGLASLPAELGECEAYLCELRLGEPGGQVPLPFLLIPAAD